MNHLNCFVLESMAKSLGTKLKGMELKDCFSNNPDEIVFIFNDYAVRCIFYHGEIYFQFGMKDVLKSRLFKPQFTEIKGRIVTEVVPHHFERSFLLAFDDGYKLVFKCHGRRSNIILYQNGLFSDLYRKQFESDHLIELSEFSNRSFPSFDQSLEIKALRKIYPFLPEELFDEFETDQQNSEFNRLISKYSDILGFDMDYARQSLIPNYTRNSVLEDVSKFTQLALKTKRLIDIRVDLIRTIDKEIQDKKTFIRSNKEALTLLINKRSDEEIGNIILSNIQQIPPASTNIKLNDIYFNRQVEIKLDDKLSAIENAEKYFRKAKGMPHRIRLLNEKIGQAETKLNELELRLRHIHEAEDWKDLKSLLEKKSERKNNEELPFKKFTEQGFDIYVGKNAESNEKILNYYSDKDDLWLHAKDVSGSHVLIKCSKSVGIPDAVLEKAAALAAYYSKNRNQSLVTVIYTQRKYVRKIKGADKGKVTVSMEKIILIKPGL